MTGIYKITSPKGRVYIGQSVNIPVRFRQYKKKACKEQRRLHSSFIKYGTENHVFEILEECDITLLNDRERHWQDVYNVCSKSGLNCRLTASSDRSGNLSQYTKNKISLKNKEARRGKNNSLSEETKLRISNAQKGSFMSEESKRLLSESRKGIIFSKKHIENLKISHGTKVIDSKTGKIYNSIKEAAGKLKLKESTLCARLRGRLINNTSLSYVHNRSI